MYLQLNGYNFLLVWWAVVALLSLVTGSSNSAHPIPHPLDPLSSQEIESAVQIFQKAKDTSKDQYIYNYISLHEPPKSELLPSFISGKSPPPGSFPRKAFLNLIQKSTQDVYEVIVNLESSTVENYALIAGVRGPITPLDFLKDDIHVVLRDARVQKRCAALGYPDTNLVRGVLQNLPLIPGEEEEWATTRRYIEYYMFGTNFVGDNFHAHPLDFCVIYDTGNRVVVDIQDLPARTRLSSNQSGNPLREGNYKYEYRGGREFLRQDDKPILTKTPEGAAYSIHGNEISWQNWKMRVGFNGREGLTLHMVSYNDSGRHRPIIYRAALAELFVPYGDPRPPFQRAQYFDVGEYGLGHCVISQTLGEDLVGPASFFKAYLHSSTGVSRVVQNAISVSEEDSGILWKHTDYRTGKGSMARSHRLVLGFTTTANNYDYSFFWKFYQDGCIQFETRLLGILYTTLVADGYSGGRHDTIVAPNIAAPFHQHFFTVRIDPQVEAGGNSVSMQDIVPLPQKTRTPSNPYGQGFKTRTTLLRTASQGRSKIAPLKGRNWIITNPNVLNNMTNSPVGWKLVPVGTTTPLLFKQDSPYRERPGWIDYGLWVSPYKEGQLYPGGRYLNGSGLTEWVASHPEGNIANTDVVLWHSFGVMHVPRPEDYPIMPVESTGFWWKPCNFFSRNPALDVPPPYVTLPHLNGKE